MPHSPGEAYRNRAGPEPSVVQGRDVGENLIAEPSSCLSTRRIPWGMQGTYWDGGGYLCPP